MSRSQGSEATETQRIKKGIRIKESSSQSQSTPTFYIVTFEDERMSKIEDYTLITEEELRIQISIIKILKQLHQFLTKQILTPQMHADGPLVTDENTNHDRISNQGSEI